ncbi:uncharacterized protein G2W53_023910 [Senna tora]|uniref:Uncharacterized protein n=1 Tax=Senna tora TaxID=362788 RepID=A0A834TC62_9FABA|nr:uncharacterized protein G2W53_023910 [Senna tora]
MFLTPRSSARARPWYTAQVSVSKEEPQPIKKEKPLTQFPKWFLSRPPAPIREEGWTQEPSKFSLIQFTGECYRNLQVNFGETYPMIPIPSPRVPRLRHHRR